MKYQYILFDADNTLWDFDAAEKNALGEVMGGFGIEIDDAKMAAYHEINTRLWAGVEAGTITRDELKVQRFKEFLGAIGIGGMSYCAPMMAEGYIQCLAKNAQLMPGAVEICKKLSETYKLYIVTNGITSVQTGRFERCEIKEYITDMFISEAVGSAKPAAEFFDHVVASVGDADRSKYIIIGDSLSSDIAGGKNAGIDTCFVNLHGEEINADTATYSISTLAEIEAILA